ncbi:hypothetical protein [Acidithiobacillus thiooxidans]|uniref:hypothetical protein n=1 Tax=Acidithiobacillus thiooxidans TaxID=930 RepID=UPI003562AA71|nr:hypothetical protein [Acidithiobacillus sp.]
MIFLQKMVAGDIGAAGFFLENQDAGILEDILQWVAPGKGCPRQGLHPARDYALNGG